MSHRFFAFLLLVLYGAPSLVGPFWHRHQPCCADASAFACHSPILAGLRTASPPAAERASPGSVSSCCCDRDRGQQRVSEPRFQEELSTRIPCIPEKSEGCSICEFYASPQMSTLPLELPTDALRATLSVPHAPPSPQSWPIEARGRGPPNHV